MSKYDNLKAHLRWCATAMRDSGDCPLDAHSDTDRAADAIEALEANVATLEKTIRSWTGPVAGYAEDPARQLAIAQERIATLERERDALRAEVDRLRVERSDKLIERTAQITAHRGCCGSEHDPANGKLHGYCVVCGVPWPCEFVGNPPKEAEA